MDGDFEDKNEGLTQQQEGIIAAFNNALSMLLARMTKEQKQMAIGNKSEVVLNNIFKCAHDREDYEVCHVIKAELDKRKANGL